jgi:CheY-like chemotaxis protein
MVPSNPTLMIVDDEAAIRATLTHIFTEPGYSVRSAMDGFSALLLIHEMAPDILLSDLNMPGMSGSELLSVVRRMYPDIHVIASSSAFSGKTVPHGVPADAFYEKATSLSFLLDVVKQQPQSDLALRRSSIGAAPIWLSPAGSLPSHEIYVFMGCPRCLRAFPKVITKMSAPIVETECCHCGTAISYAVVPSSGLASVVSPAVSYADVASDLELVSSRFVTSSSGQRTSN